MIDALTTLMLLLLMTEPACMNCAGAGGIDD